MVKIMANDLPPLNTLKAFDVAARLSSFSKAAEELSLTPSAISRQIQGLEEALDVRLFDRSGPGLVLTSQGVRYLETVTPLLERLRNATKNIRRSKSTLRLGVMPYFFNNFLVHHLQDFIDNHSDIDIVFNTRSSYRTFDQDEVDANIRFGKSPQKQVVNHHLVHQDFHPFAAPSLLKNCDDITRFEQLAQFPWLHNWTRTDAWERYVRNAGHDKLEGPSHLSFDDAQMTLEAAKAGLGVALVALPLGKNELESGRLRCLWDEQVGDGYSYYLSYPERFENHPTLIKFRSWISNLYQ